MKTRHKTIHHDRYVKLIEQLTAERKRLCLSQAEVGVKLDMTQSEISKLETLERRLDILEFQQLLSVYRVGQNRKLREIVIKFLELESL
jgi:transcriptional regulator with XRE-family HTH domain